MRVAGIREFRNRAPEMVKSGEIVFVTRHGKLSGILIPLEKPEELPVDLRRDLLERLGQVISQHLGEHGVNEKDVQRDFKAWKSQRRKSRRRR